MKDQNAMKQKKPIVIETQKWQPEHLIDMYEDIPIQDASINYKQLWLMDTQHVRGEPMLMYYDPEERFILLLKRFKICFFKEIILSLLLFINTTLLTS